MKLIKLQELPEESVSHNSRIRKYRMLADGEAGPITNYARAVFPPGEQVAAHTHSDMMEIFTVESGCGEIRIDGTSHDLSPGVTVLVEPGEAHAIINTGSGELILTYLGVVVR